MNKRCTVILAVLAAMVPLVGCVPSKVQENAYLLDDAQVGGDPAKSLKPIKNILVWPLENISPGSKAKGIETRYTGVLIDTLTLRSGFDRVVILEEDQAKDLMTRAGEELGLKKKPKAPLDGALIATKLGQLSGTECILLGRIEDYDEEKVEKATITVASASFNLLDAREKAYPTMDSFTPVKRVWRVNLKRTSMETPFAARKGLDDTFRLMLEDVVDRLSADLGQGAAASGKALARRVEELSAAAEKSLGAGEFDKATATWNEVLKLQPDNKRAKRGLEEVEKRKREAEERAKAAALKKQIEEIRAKALEAEKGENLEGAIAEWKKIPELDKGNREAADRIASLEKQLADRKKKEIEKIRGKALEAEKNGDLEGALAEWKKIPELDKGNKEAADGIAALEKKIAEKKKREAEEAERKAAAEKKAREEAEKKAKEEAERKAAAEKKAKEEAERKAVEDAKKAAEPASAPGTAVESAPAAGAEAATPPAPEPKAEAVPAPEPKAEGAPAPEPKSEVVPAPEPKAEVAPVPEPKAEVAEPKPEVAPAAVPKPEPAAARKVEEKPAAAAPASGGELDPLRNQAMDAFNKENYEASRDLWKKILEKAPGDKQAKEMLETTEMLLNALK